MMEDIGKIRANHMEKATRTYLETIVKMGVATCMQSGEFQCDDDTEYLFSIVLTKKQ